MRRPERAGGRRRARAAVGPIRRNAVARCDGWSEHERRRPEPAQGRPSGHRAGSANGAGHGRRRLGVHPFRTCALPELDLTHIDLRATGQDHARAAADQFHDRRHATRRGHQPASERGSASLGDRHVRRFAAREPAIPQLPGADARAAPPGPRRPLCWPISAPRNCARPTAWTWRAGRWMPTDASSISIRCRKRYSRRATATGAASWRRSLAQRGRADRGQGSGVGPLRLGGLCARRGGRGGDRCRRRRRHQLGRGGGPARPRCRRPCGGDGVRRLGDSDPGQRAGGTSGQR